MADTLVVIRSGATDYDLHGRIRGTLDVPLCDKGIDEARDRAVDLTSLSLDVLATSSDTAALETARIVGRRVGLEPKVIPGLENLDQGLWQGMLADDIRRRQPRLHRLWQANPWTVAPPEGETLDEACERAETALVRFLRRCHSRRVGLVLPDPLDRVVCWLAMGEPVGDLWRRGAREPGVRHLPLCGQWVGPRVTGVDLPMHAG